MKSHQVVKLVFSSSATVYGEPQYLPVDEQHVTGQRVTNPYGRTKYFIEEILRDLCTSDPVRLRFKNPFDLWISLNIHLFFFFIGGEYTEMERHLFEVF
jgi:UDP-glucose 4-epimerase